jgi:hypothetical protein
MISKNTLEQIKWEIQRIKQYKRGETIIFLKCGWINKQFHSQNLENSKFQSTLLDQLIGKTFCKKVQITIKKF